MWFINENRPIPNNRYFLFVSDTSSLVTATATALQKRIGFDYKNLSDTNAGFVGNGTTFQTLLQNANIIDTDARLRVTDIVVLGGNNDRLKYVANVKPAMETFSNYCKQHYPLAKVWVGMTGWADCGIDSSSVVNIGMQFKDVLEYYAWANAYGMCYMNNVQYSTHYSGFYSDTYTLNSTGLAYVGGHVAECLLNGTTTVYEAQPATMTYRSGCSAVGNTNVYTSINDNIASLYIRNGSNNYCGFNFPSRFISPRTFYNPFPICDLDDVWCTGRTYEYASMTSGWLPVPNAGSDGSQFIDEARLMLKGRTLYLQLRSNHINDGIGYQVNKAVFRETIRLIDDAMYC